MDKESKGIVWFGNIYRKLQTLLSDVDSFASKNSVRVSGEDTDPPRKSNDAKGYDGNSEISKSILSDERVDDGNGSGEKVSDTVLSSDQETCLSVPLFEEYIGNNNQTETTSLGLLEPMSLQDIKRRVSDDSQSSISAEAQITCSSSERFRKEVPCDDYGVAYSSRYSPVDSTLVQVSAEIPPALVEENMAKMRSTACDAVNSSNDEHDAVPLETVELYDVANREDHSDIDDHMLYAARRRTRKLRSFKKKITDALASRRLREKEYEQLAIWFGDASMGSDLDTAEALPSKTATAIETKRPLASEDSDWELL